jgi:hypothetical protein
MSTQLSDPPKAEKLSCKCEFMPTNESARIQPLIMWL